MGVELCGYGPYEKRLCTEVLDPLYARALSLRSGERHLLIISLDVVGIDLAMRDTAAAQIEHRCGVPAECILFAASHTHSGPSTSRLIGWGEQDPGYLASLPALLVRAAEGACRSAAPARLGACRQRITEVGMNREQPAVGPVDTAAQLMRVDDAEGGTLAALFNFGAHGVARYPFTSRISADWMGLAGAYIQAALGARSVLYLQGCQGNIDPHRTWLYGQRDNAVLRQKVYDLLTGDVAKRLADQALPALRAVETRSEVPLRASWYWLDLPCLEPDPSALRQIIAAKGTLAERMTLAALRPLYQRLASETEEEKAWRRARYEVDAARMQLQLLEAGQRTVRAPVQIMQIGEAVLVAWPGEVFVELGIELRQRSPFPLTFVVGCANDTAGYFFTPAAAESQGRPNEHGKYPVSFTAGLYGRLPFRADVGRILVEETLHLLNTL